MVYLLFVALIINCFLHKKSKIGAILLLALLFVLFAYSSGLPDENIYRTRLTMYSSYSSFTEPLYSYTMKFLGSNGITYESWLVILAVLYVVSIFLFSIKFAPKSFCIPIAMVSLFPFCMDATQQRNTFALIFLLQAVSILFKDEEKLNKNKIILFVVFIVLASCIHFEFILYLLMLIPISCDRKKSRYLGITIFLILLFGTRILISSLSGVFPIIGKLSSTLKNVSYGNSIKYILIWIIMASIYIVPYYYLKKKNKMLCDNYTDTVYSINLFFLCLVPMCFYEPVLYRFQQNILLLGYCGLARFIKPNAWNKLYKKNVLLVSGVLTLLFFVLYLLIFSNSNFNDVFRPLFENNKLLF